MPCLSCPPWASASPYATCMSALHFQLPWTMRRNEVASIPWSTLLISSSRDAHGQGKQSHQPDRFKESIHMDLVLPQVPCYTSGSIIQDPLPEECQRHPAIATKIN